MDKKYEITDNYEYEFVENEFDNLKIKSKDVKVYQIRALKDFGDVKKGDLGGYIENEENLSQEGDCWVSSGCVINGAKVTENAIIYNTKLSGGAKVSGNVKLHDCYIRYANIIGDCSMYNCSINNEVTINLSCDLYSRGAILSTHVITTSRDARYLCIHTINDNIITFSKHNNTIYVICGDFYGYIEYFEKDLCKIYSPDDKILKEYLAAIKLAKIHFGIE